MGHSPNILLIMTDQQRPDHTGFGGNPVVNTPHLDRLAAAGTVFSQARVANPICMPNRCSIATGRMPSVHGSRINGIPLDPRERTYMQSLREAGYLTALIGKSHLQNMGIATMDMAPFYPRPGDARSIDGKPGWDGYEDLARHHRENVTMPDDFYGFARTELTINHSDTCSGHYGHWLRSKVERPERRMGPANARYVHPDWGEIYQTSLPEELYPTTWIAERSVAFLEEAAAGQQAFFLQASFPDPHHPFTPPGRYWSMYDPADVSLPENYHDEHRHSLPHIKRMRQRPAAKASPLHPFGPDEELLRLATAKEFGMITMIDDAIGRILRSLADLRLAGDTIVIFTSDHGDMFGDHGILLKGAVHYDGPTRVPLVIHDPRRPGGQSSGSLVSSLDLAPTILELAGLPLHHGLQGCSLLPLLKDPDRDLREHLLIEEDAIMDLARTGRSLRMRTLVTQSARLTRYAGSDAGELFHLADDPLEMDNLFARGEGPAGLRAEMHERLTAAMMEYADESPKPTAFA